jgi:hypothetical protein
VNNLNSTIDGSLTFVAVFEIMIFLAAAAAFEPGQEAGRFSRDGLMIFLAAERLLILARPFQGLSLPKLLHKAGLSYPSPRMRAAE